MHDPDIVPALPGTMLALPVPPRLAEAFGYPGEARFVGFSWEPAGDELVYDDRRRWDTGDGHVFLAYKRHPAVFPHLAPYNLGSSDGEAKSYLIIDRDLSRASVAPLAEACSFLEAQHPPRLKLESRAPLEEMRDLVQTLAQGWHEETVDPEVIRRHRNEQRLTMARLLAWLDQVPVSLNSVRRS